MTDTDHVLSLHATLSPPTAAHGSRDTVRGAAVVNAPNRCAPCASCPGDLRAGSTSAPSRPCARGTGESSTWQQKRRF